ncbi:gluconokinase [Halobacillus litoralis]|uniref:gluconokinase n=1 Tax=Halobacillus litoralis TaxID=45668 RepID=UPI001CD43354|nr:gluconokinase [Halobacillus litoralis]MCA0972170.1 gluconokinase [Halobacillus litoralis]
MGTHVIGLDIGTTSAKAVLFDLSGHVVSEHEEGYPLLHPQTGYAEQDPAEIEQAARTALKECREKSGIEAKDISGVGISAAMHSLICMNEEGLALSPSIIWADGRSVEEAAWLKREHPEIYMATGTPLHPMSPLAKLVWMKNRETEEYREATYFVSIKEYLTYRWFGEKTVDYSIAAATGLFNIHEHKWEPEALKLAGIKEEQLFTPVSPDYKMSGLADEVVKETGLAEETPFVIGGSDGPLANLGIGAIQPGETAVTIGTSGAIRQFSDRPLLDEKQEIFSYSFTDDLWITGGPSNNGGLVLSWLQKLWSGENDHYTMEQFSDMAAETAAGSDRLLFLPYLNGERAPFWKSEAKGSFIGLTPSHRKEHMTRAAMEGVLFSIVHIADALNRVGNSIDKIYASGGFARSSVWVQMLADMMQKDVYIPTSHQSSAWGAAWLTLCSTGQASSLEDIKQKIPMEQRFEPNAENKEIYEELFNIYKDVSSQLQTTYQKLHTS